MKKRPGATQTQIAIFGHIAGALRQKMAERGMTVPDLQKAIGMPRTSPGVYTWLAAKGGPSEENRKRLSKALGIPEADLIPRTDETAKIGRPRGSTTIAPRTADSFKPRPSDVLSFAMNDEGQARIKVDVTLAADRALPLLRTLMDAGIGTAVPKPLVEHESEAKEE